MKKEIVAKRRQRADHVTKMRQILQKANARDEGQRDFTADEQAEYDRLDKAQEDLGKEIKAAETWEERDARLTDLEAEMVEPAGRQTATRPEPLEAAPTALVERLKAAGLAIDVEGLSDRDREIVESRTSEPCRAAFRSFIRGRRVDPRFQASLQADSDPAGGAMVAPIQFVSDVIKKVNDLVFIRALATKRTVVQAQSLGAPTLEADPADSDWTSELATGNEDTTMSLGRREWHPHPVAKLIKLSNKLVRLTAGGAEALVVERLGYKFGITEEKAFLLGSGASQPLGVFTASSSGISTARDFNTGNTSTAIGADGLIEALHQLKAPYRRNSAWCFHRDAVRAIRKLKDTNGQYLWNVAGIGQASLASGLPETILNRPYYESEYAPNTFTTGKYVGIVGDFSYFWIADALDMTLQRLIELYAANNQIGYIGRKETDGMPVFEEAFARVTLA